MASSIGFNILVVNMLSKCDKDLYGLKNKCKERRVRQKKACWRILWTHGKVSV